MIEKYLIHPIIGLIICVTLTSCGQSGHLYLPTDHASHTIPSGK